MSDDRGAEVTLGEPPRSILVFRALALGDLLCAVPALRALRRAFPQAHVGLIGLAERREFVDRFGEYIDELIEFPGWPGIPERDPAPERLPRFLGSIQRRHVDLAIQLHGNGMHSNTFVELLGARNAAGTYLPALGRPSYGAWRPYPGHANEIHRCLAAVAALGIPAEDDGLEFPIRPADDASLERALGGRGLPSGEYAVVHPGATRPSRRWAIEGFATIADELAREGLTVVLTGSTAEASRVAGVRRSMRGPSIDLSGRTDLGALGRLVADARLVVTNDTSVSHVAAATRTPSVVIFLASDRERWRPLDTRRHLAVGVGEPNPCRHLTAAHRCLADSCLSPEAAPDGRQGVSVTAVRQAVRLALGAPPGTIGPRPRLEVVS
jgi:ADP-heptose:LPS heptosyltransferase